MKYSLILLCILSLSSRLAAFEKVDISCLHNQLCFMAQSILNEDGKTPNKDYSLNVLVNIKGDPHEFEPSSREIKNILKSNFLLAGPKALNPWITKFGANRKNPTIHLDLPKENSYNTTNSEALSHFWLYPEIYCALKQDLKKDLIKRKIISDYQLLTEECDNERARVENELRETLQKINYPIVLTHDALLPLLDSLKSKSNVIVAIKGSGHHSETTAESVKKLYVALKHPRAIWVLEDNIHVPDNIISKRRDGDITINLDTNSAQSKVIFEALKNLNLKLKAIQ